MVEETTVEETTTAPEKMTELREEIEGSLKSQEASWNANASPMDIVRVLRITQGLLSLCERQQEEIEALKGRVGKAGRAASSANDWHKRY